MKRTRYRNYLLGVLLVILAFNYTDRFALGLVLENIKHDLRLTDAQLGFLGGIAFALFYSIVGIPIARWADRGNRVTIIWLTAAIWSVMVMLFGMAGNFAQLVLIRVGIGVGEAGCIPPAHSLIADNFTRAERPRAVGIYMQGTNLSLVIGYVLAGWLNELYGWHMMFILLGLPGLGLAVLARFTLREPRRPNVSIGAAGTSGPLPPPRLEVAAATSAQPNAKGVFLTLWTNVTFRQLLYFVSLQSFFAYGILQWQPTFFVRSFGLGSGEIGTWFALVCGLASIVGTHLGGECASRYAANNEGVQLKASAIAMASFGSVFWGLIYLSHSYYLAFALMALSSLGTNSLNGPVFALIQTLVPPRMRAISIALIFMFANLIGLGLGPLAVGVLSDALRPMLGNESLRYALLAFCPGFMWCAWHLWLASRTVGRDLEAVRTEPSMGTPGEYVA